MNDKPKNVFSNESTRSNRSVNAGGHRANQAASVNGAVMVSRLLYAVLIVGFVGYYMDKALQIIRQ